MKRTVHSIQYLRGVAALMVVAFHAIVSRWNAPHVEDLALGVDIFFVISGYIMMATTRTMRPREFAYKRLVRIVPMYWLMTAVLLAAVGIHFFRHAVVTPGNVTKSLLFIPYIGQEGVFPLLGPGWTLNVEMFFYLIFTAALLLPYRLRLPTVGALFVTMVVVGAFVHMTTPALWLYTRPRLLEFVIGMALAQFWRMRGQWGLIMVVAGFATLLFGEPYGGIIGAGLIVAGALAAEPSVPSRALLWLGDISYSLYLSHLLVIAIVKAMMGHSPVWLYVPVCGVLSIITAGVIYRCAERPIQRFLSTPKVPEVINAVREC
jgi:exopolysaccharide production protein ExoZ